ncbi:MAG TPA: hypothetical protein VHE55_03225 [Fimbriimonadaceae bacterium]|nr:hypothetical protein [Fimbriimonadaceae bacterium]
MQPNRAPPTFGLGLTAVLGGLGVAGIVSFLLFGHFSVFGFLIGSIVGAAMVAAICPRRSAIVSIAYVMPGLIGFFFLPYAMAALPGASPRDAALWQLLALGHLVLSISTIEFARRIPSPRIRGWLPLALGGTAYVAGIGLSFATAQHYQDLATQTHDKVGAAFERDILPRLLASPRPVTWAKADLDGKAYSVQGELARGGHIQLGGRDTYNVEYAITLPAGLFEMGDQSDLAGRLQRAKVWLKQAGVADGLLAGLNVYSPKRWESSLPPQGRLTYLTPGEGQVTLTGLASFDPESLTFRD